MNLGFMFSVSTWKRWWVGSSTYSSSTRWTWDLCSRWVPGRDDGWGAHLIHPLPDEPGIHVIGEYLGEMIGRELSSFILYQMNMGFMFLVSIQERWCVGSSSHSSSTRWTCGFMFSVNTLHRWWVGSSSHSAIYQMNLGFMFSVSTRERWSGGELISLILYQMNLGFMFLVSTWQRCALVGLLGSLWYQHLMGQLHLSRCRAVWTHHKTLIHTGRNWDRYRELYRMPFDTVAILSVSVLGVYLGFC